jgi:hypothetical protein
MLTKPVIHERTCMRCGFRWYPRKPGTPLRCGKCLTPYWNIPPKKEPTPTVQA